MDLFNPQRPAILHPPAVLDSVFGESDPYAGRRIAALDVEPDHQIAADGHAGVVTRIIVGINRTEIVAVARIIDQGVHLILRNIQGEDRRAVGGEIPIGSRLVDERLPPNAILKTAGLRVGRLKIVVVNRHPQLVLNSRRLSLDAAIDVDVAVDNLNGLVRQRSGV